MKVKINEAINKILNCRLFVLFVGVMLFVKTIYFYKNTIAIVEEIQKQTIIGTISFLITSG